MKTDLYLRFLLISLLFIVSACVNKTDPEIFKRSDAPPANEFEYMVFQFINRIRIDYNLSPYVFDNRLSYIARSYSIRMYRENFFSHFDKDGKNVEDRLLDNKYLFFIAGENLFMSKHTTCDTSAKSAKMVVDSWFQSVGHRRLLLSDDLVYVGIGMFCSGGTMYVTMLATKTCNSFNSELMEGFIYYYDIPINRTINDSILDIYVENDCNILSIYAISIDSLVELTNGRNPMILDLPLRISINSPYRCNVNVTLCFRNDLDYKIN